jgi:hypothetical protein
LALQVLAEFVIVRMETSAPIDSHNLTDAIE